ncbi:hypothetical protein [Flavisolibacter ginsenosidimutans]|uniref:Uncharacterized protein n=1 Tax=Flavisolibacter ginsenosidimutans TaxID=661481 RepID=A0A5B8UJE9_9BACT|nr:hypothetical protein [Flavisolibacter ginsenosidimutans]QEC56817.1 hypothetical protein FSB75_13220 [Flavisolibacter ginsenosidimutans]
MNKQFRFPILKINEVTPLLSTAEGTFAHSIKATTELGKVLKLYENKGINLGNYIDEKVECLLEITQGTFEYRLAKNATLPSNIILFNYEWSIRPFEFFLELTEMNKDVGLNVEHENLKRKQFEDAANKLFQEWGLNGLGIGIYDSKPLFNSSDGFFLLNEYEFEEQIENLELNDEVCIKIEECLLRGIRPCEAFTKPEPKQVAVQQKQKEEPESKKRRLWF